MASKVPLSALLAKRDRLMGQVEKLHRRAQELTTELQVKRFLTHFASVEDYKTTLEELVDEINILQVGKNQEPDYSVLDEAEEMFIEIKTAAQSVLNSIQLDKTSETSDQESSSQLQPARARLPKISLPHFNGELKNWTLFRETFENLIHFNQSLSDVEKMHFLLGCLGGSALNMCQGLAPTAGNYSIFWKMLKEKYDDPSLLANNYLNQIFSFKALQTENADSLNYFLENFHSAVEALKKIDVGDLLDYVLAYLAFLKIPPETQKTFENARRSGNCMKYDELISFLKEQAKICVRTGVKPRQEHPKKLKFQNFLVKQSEREKCFLCASNFHHLKACPKFLEKSPRMRYELIRQKKLCFNCLSYHQIAKCTSKFRCKYCSERHHSLLHLPGKEEHSNGAAHNQDQKSPENQPVALMGCTNSSAAICSEPQMCEKIVLLSTAIVVASDNKGFPKKCRFLLDSGSQANFITEECARFLRLKIRPCNSKMRGLGGNETKIQGCVTITLSSHLKPNNQYVVETFVVKRIVDQLPNTKLEKGRFDYLDDIALADPEFYIPHRIDGILGVEMLTRVLGSHRIVGPPDYPIALSTSLGYVVMGSVPKLTPSQNVHAFCNFRETSSLENSLKRFWELEELPCPTPNSKDPETDFCEEFFRTTHVRNEKGRFVVKLPFNLSPDLLGDSYQSAVARFFQLERKFRSNPIFKKQYKEVIHEYISQGHMILDRKCENSSLGYFIPHHGISKSDSSSTPLRIVFDASCKSSSSYSLNDLLHSGPKLQTDLVAILLRFRLGQFGCTADLKQMFRQILVNDEDRRFQRIVWRDSENDPLKTFSLTTVTFGVKCSPYLALRVVQQLAENEKERFPGAAEIVIKDRYVDDLVFSTDDPTMTVQYYNEIIEMFHGAGFEIHKWATNCTALNQIISSEKPVNAPVDLLKNSLKVLGMLWDPVDDILQFKLKFDRDPPEKSNCTKRKILSVVARCYDPLGFLAPAMLIAKLLIKDLWQQTLDWDDIPSDDIKIKWHTFYNELSQLTEIKIPRFLQIVPNQSIILVGFADACATSYGAVVYLRNSELGHVSKVNLLLAKSKVAPSNSLTIPKLELSSCLLLAKLLNFVTESCKGRICIQKIYALSDSTIALHWITGSSSKLETFVSNRVNSIKRLIPSDHWCHIPGKNNAADVISRGQGPMDLKNNSQWWNGPDWLKSPPSSWPINTISTQGEPEEPRLAMAAVQSLEEHPLIGLIKRHSNWLKLLRSVVYLLKFIKKIPVSSRCSTSNLRTAELYVVKVIQAQFFKDEITLLMKNVVPPKLRFLRPFLQDSLIRVGGRIQAAEVDYEARHPILLPKNAPLVPLLIDHVHATNFHTGAHLTLSLLRARYWILSARNLVRGRLKMCNFCFRSNPKNHYPLMGNLPPCRLQVAKAFLKTGVDYAGPLSIIPYRKRGVRAVKAYICLFVCLVTKSIHIELVSDLSTANFMQAFKRFLARRGTVREMFSDNGSNFLGAKAELRDLYHLILSKAHNEAIDNFLAVQEIKWHLIPPNAPHMGGLWESNVKVVKNHLFKGIKGQLLTFEEMYTVLTQIEALLNSRPLSVLSSDPTDPKALTPSHFLTLGPPSDFPTPNLQEIKMSRLSRYQLLDRIIQDFWKRWHVEYLHSLQPRSKWGKEAPTVEVGDVVLLEMPNNPPLNWPLGIIEQTYPGADNIVRVVEVRTKNASYRRPLCKIYKLPTQ